MATDAEHAAHIGDILDICASIARSQPFAPDTTMGTRQAWMREEIARKIEALAERLAGIERE